MKLNFIKPLLMAAVMLLGGVSYAWGETIETMGSTTEGWGSNNHSYTLPANKTLQLSFTISETSGGDFAGHYVNILQNGDKMGIQPGGGFYYIGDAWWDETHIARTDISLDGYKDVLPGSNVTILVRRFGTQIDYFVRIVKDATTLTRRLVTKEETFTAADITIVLGADNAVLTSIEDNTTDSRVIPTQGTLLGSEGNYGGFGAGERKDYVIPAEGSLTLHFKNYTSKIESWHNWVFEMQYGDKYADIVTGGGTWGTLLDGAGLSWDGQTWPSGTHKDIMDAFNGADVYMTITREGSKVSVTADHTAIDGETWTVKYSFTPTTDGFATSDVTFRLLTESSHIDLLPTYLEVNSSDNIWALSHGNMTYDANNVRDAFRVTNTTATQSFETPYVLSDNETVSVAFTAYHGYLGSASTSTVQLLNSNNDILVAYTYNRNSQVISDVKFGGITATGFENISNVASLYTSSSNANGFVGNGKPYQTTDGYNPIITMKVSKNGKVEFNVTRGQGGINQGYDAVLDGVTMDIAAIRIIDNCNNSDRSIGISDLSITSSFSIPVEITAAGWATLYTPYALDFSKVAGLTAYTASLSGDIVTLTEVDDVPANTGVVLRGDEDSYSIPVITSSETAKGDLTGNAAAATAYDAFSGYDLYMLALNDSRDAQFTLASAGSIAAGKAFLKVPQGGSVKAFSVVLNDETTGINTVQGSGFKVQDSEIFNLAGQRMSKMQKGINIVNGKKLIVK